MADEAAVVITPKAFFEHWAAHRRLTRRVIDAFPEDKLFTFSVGGMRPFGVLALEMLTMAEPTLKGMMTGTWDSDMSRDPVSKDELLRRWDESTKRIETMTADFDVAAFRKSSRPSGSGKAGSLAALLRRGQRDPTSGSGLRVPARPGNPNSSVLCA